MDIKGNRDLVTGQSSQVVETSSSLVSFTDTVD